MARSAWGRPISVWRLALLLLVCNLADGQPPLATTFEVASVKPSPPIPPNGRVYFGPPRGGPGTADPGQITWSYATLKSLLITAYDVSVYQVIGPSWIETERYDIVVKVSAGTTKEQVRAMWQNLLGTRFGLVVHHESKEFQVDELLSAKGGSKLKETTWDSATPLPPGPPQTSKNGELTSPGVVSSIFPDAAGAHAITVGRAQPIAQLASMMTNALRHPVLDRTGLTGKYDFNLEYSIDLTGLPVPPGVPAPPPATGLSTLPDLAAAVQQQLGLRLVAGKANLDVVVIDKAEKVPTPN